jgi:hypothetical protein
MMTPVRTIIDLPDHQLDALDRLCTRERISRAEAVRRAVGQYVADRRVALANAFGLWRDRPGDGLQYQEQRRREWSSRTGRRSR